MTAEGLSDGQVWGRYLIVKGVGAEAGAELYEAVDASSTAERRVLLKIGAEGDWGPGDPTAPAERALSAVLSHPSVVRLLDAGELQGRPFFALEHVDGIRYDQLLARARSEGRSIPVPAAVWIAHEMLRALAHVHGACDGQQRPLGIVHATLCPRKVLLSSSGEVKLTGFEGALAAGLADRTRAMMAAAEAAYLAPEQVRGRPADARTDLFSTGLVLYGALTGLPAHDQGTRRTLSELALENKLGSPSEHRPGIGVALDAIVTRALAVEPDGRYQSAADFASELETCLEQTAPGSAAAEIARLVAEARGGSARLASIALSPATSTSARAEPSPPVALPSTDSQPLPSIDLQPAPPLPLLSIDAQPSPPVATPSIYVQPPPPSPSNDEKWTDPGDTVPVPADYRPIVPLSRAASDLHGHTVRLAMGLSSSEPRPAAAVSADLVDAEQTSEGTTAIPVEELAATATGRPPPDRQTAVVAVEELGSSHEGRASRMAPTGPPPDEVGTAAVPIEVMGAAGAPGEAAPDSEGWDSSADTGVSHSAPTRLLHRPEPRSRGDAWDVSHTAQTALLGRRLPLQALPPSPSTVSGTMPGSCGAPAGATAGTLAPRVWHRRYRASIIMFLLALLIGLAGAAIAFLPGSVSMRLGQEMSRGGWKLRFDSISVEGAPGAHAGALVLRLTAVHPTEELDPKQLELIDGGGPCPIRSWASSPDSRSSKVVSWTVGLPRADTLSLRFYTAKRGPLRITLSR